MGSERSVAVQPCARRRRCQPTTTVTERVVPVEILSFDGYPNWKGAVELVAHELGVQADVRIIDVPDPVTAEKMRFLGSPTVRIAGQDVEPGAETRTDFAHSCRLYQTNAGIRGQPDERWVRANGARR